MSSVSSLTLTSPSILALRGLRLARKVFNHNCFVLDFYGDWKVGEHDFQFVCKALGDTGYHVFNVRFDSSDKEASFLRGHCAETRTLLPSVSMETLA